MSEFLIRWKFNFFGREVNESGLIGRFERYGVRYGVGMVKFGILLDFVGNFEYWGRVRFLSWCVE